ncbi:hypothetical protein RvY_03572-2 [Ramazzottius varieornatus]|uniref:Uncharacterized protein n=1 Tax=Ramazzottius varieornatus TaxID=947166 RepID=A0A1D1UNJ6_RAMVA|nr:hypothetical protein RvY_03572-2 [Ramazzottius varieornatus]
MLINWKLDKEVRQGSFERTEQLNFNWLRQSGHEVPTLSDLNHSSNVASTTWACVDHLDSSKSRNFFTSLPYATGLGFFGNHCELVGYRSFLSFVDYSHLLGPDVLRSVRRVEKVLAEGAGKFGALFTSLTSISDRNYVPVAAMQSILKRCSMFGLSFF